MTLEENQAVLCTVKRIEGTTVFLELPGGIQGTMIFSEVSPGRIRNIREYVVPNKKVVCKILRIRSNNIELSLRRVTSRERDEILEKYKKERQFKSMLKPILKDKTPEVFEKIKSQNDIIEFIEQARKDPKILEKFFSKLQAQQLAKILAEKKEKDKEVKKIITITSTSPSGIKDIKEILESKEAEIKYKGSSKFTIKITAKDYKTANNILNSILDEIKEKAKKLHASLEIKDIKTK